MLDTRHTNLTGTGQINFMTETLDLKFAAKPKDNSLLALRGPILVNGQFGALAVRPDLKSVAVRGGAATVLGVVATPFAALIPFVELGNAKDTDCAPLVARVRQFIDQSPADGSRGGHRVS